MQWRTAVGVLAMSMLITVPASEAVRAEADATPSPAGVQRAASKSDICRGLAERRATLEEGGIRALLAMQPDDVAATLGPAGVARVNDYIELSERVLFKCPPGALNAALAVAAETADDEPPPLPGKGPRRPVARVTESRAASVPLPMRAPLRLPLRAGSARTLPPGRAPARPARRPARTVPIPVTAPPPGGASSGADGPVPFRFPQSQR